MDDHNSMERSQNSNSELLKLLASQVKSVPASIIAVLFIIAFMASKYVPIYCWGAWLSLAIFFQIFRWRVLWKLPEVDSISTEQKLLLIVIITIMSGGFIGLSLIFFPTFSLLEKTIQTTLLLSLAAGSLAVTVGHLPIYLAYISTTLVPLSLLWIFVPASTENNWMHTALGVLIWGYIAVLINLSRGLYKQFLDSYGIRQQFIAANKKIKLALDRAKSASEAKTRFLASASHDLRQPIHALALFSASLNMQALDNKSRSIAEHINKATQALSIQLDSLLDISKLDAGLVEVNLGTVNLRTLLLHLYNEFLPIAEKKEIELQLDIPSHNAITYSDNQLLERILRNLISNAVKYTDKGKVCIGIKHDRDKYCIFISDTGRGIPENEKKQIFEEFYQISNPHRDRNQGLGLGLSIVERLANLLKINVNVESQSGKGSRFYMNVDRVKSAYEFPKIEKSKTMLIENLTVLVIDDEPEILAGMKVLFEDLGCKPILATGTSQAVNLSKNQKPDIVLADFRLREHDSGIAAISAIRDLYGEVPAVLISGDTSPKRLKEAKDAKLELLHKPVLIEDITQKISELMEKGMVAHEQLI